MVTDIVSIVALLGILGAFRSQRVTNANLARGRHQEAFAEARMVYSELSELDSDNEDLSPQLALIVTVLGTHAIVRVDTQVWIKTEQAQLGPMWQIEPVLVPNAPLLLPQPPVALDPGTRVQWQISWGDRHGYRWGFYRDRYDRHPDPTMLERPAGRGPTGPPTGRQRLRNVLVPYDYWPTETVAVLPASSQNGAGERLAVILAVIPPGTTRRREATRRTRYLT